MSDKTWIANWVKHVEERLEIVTKYVERHKEITGLYPSIRDVASMMEVDYDLAKAAVKRARERAL